MLDSLLVALCVLGIIQIGAMFYLARLARRYVDGHIDAIVTAINAELVRLVAKEPCQSGAILNAIGEAVGARAGVAAKAALMADLSHAKRAANTDAAEGQLALVDESAPALGGMLAGMSKRGQSKLFANPLVQLAMSALMGRGGGGAIPGNGATTESTLGSVRSRLQKGGS